MIFTKNLKDYKMEYIFGIHPVIEALEASKTIDKILIKKDLTGEAVAPIFQMAREQGIPIQRVPLEKLNRITRKNHQGVVAYLSAVAYHDLTQIVPTLFENGVLPFVVVLDGITDVRNFGAIARTAECCGVNALVIPMQGSVSVGSDAVKTSAGALLHLPVCREKSIVRAVSYLKNSGYQIVCATEKSSIPYTKADYTTPIALVMGAEDVGINPEVLRLADTCAAIPMFGRIGSLNVGVAAGVMMYEVVRQRLAADVEII